MGNVEEVLWFYPIFTGTIKLKYLKNVFSVRKDQQSIGAAELLNASSLQAYSIGARA